MKAHLWFSIFLLLTAVFAQVHVLGSAHAEQTQFSAPKAACNSAFMRLKLLLEYTDGTSGTFESRALNRPAFQRFLLEKKVGPLATLEEREKDLVLVEYLRNSLKRFENPALLARSQQVSIRRELDVRGAAGKTLKQLSRENRDRILSHSLTPTAGPVSVLRKLVNDSVQPFFYHNSQLQQQAVDTALVSSRQLSQIGLPGGLNSRYFYNRSFLQNDNNVFFHVGFRAKGKPPAYTAEFGPHTLLIEDRYAAQNGWISAYNMYPRELADIADRAWPGELERLDPHIRAEFRGREFAKPERHQLLRYLDERTGDFEALHSAAPGLLDALRGRLHQFDFTVGDFMEIVHQQLVHALERLEVSSSKKFAVALETLEQGDSDEINALLKELCFKPLGIPERYEFKIPVAVPPGVLRAGRP